MKNIIENVFRYFFGEPFHQYAIEKYDFLLKKTITMFPQTSWQKNNYN